MRMCLYVHAQNTTEYRYRAVYQFYIPSFPSNMHVLNIVIKRKPVSLLISLTFATCPSHRMKRGSTGMNIAHKISLLTAGAINANQVTNAPQYTTSQFRGVSQCVEVT